MGQHTATGTAGELTVASLTAEHRAAAQRRHPAGRRTMTRALVTLAAAGILAGTSTGIASATPGDPGQCTGHGVCVDDPTSGPGYLGPFAYGDGSVTRNGGHFSFTQRLHGVENEAMNAAARALHAIRSWF